MNRYDDRARLVFHYAREEGNRLGHAMVGPEHLLLGLMREGGTAASLLGEFGATLDGLRRAPRPETSEAILRYSRTFLAG